MNNLEILLCGWGNIGKILYEEELLPMDNALKKKKIDGGGVFKYTTPTKNVQIKLKI